MKKNTKIANEIIDFTKELKLPGIRNNFIEEIKEANKSNEKYEVFLHKLLQLEYDKRMENRKLSRIRNAGFPFKKTIEDLEVEHLPVEAKKYLNSIRTLDFLKTGQNVILSGNPGTGKTHLAIGLGVKACLKGLRVLFTSIPHLIIQLKESRSERTLRAFGNKFEKYDLVIADELGYISFDKEGAELLFTHLSLRAGRKSTIVTTNLSFDRWEEIFGDTVLTAAIVDRLTHKAFLINMNGNSYRIKETQDWLNNSN
ncbi:MAG: ATP-binding protein [archaeon]|nr:ATP-binding protein [archaeon]